MPVISETYSTLLYLKFLQALIVCDDLNSFLEEADELGIDYKSFPLLEMSREIVGAYTTEHSLPHTIEKNVVNFISIHRSVAQEKIGEEKSKRIELCNQVITSVNQSRGKKEYPFYPALINHLYHGIISNIWNHYLHANNPEAMTTLLDSYISLEYYVLYSHAELLSDQEFMAFGCNFLLNGAYLESIEFLLDEIPELENDPVFIRRIRKILTENENLLSEAQGKPVAESESYLEEDDQQYIKDKYLWKLQRKVKKRINRLQKDS